MVHPVPNCGFARTYIISGTDGLMIIDPGSVGTAEDILETINQAGMKFRNVRFVAATHFHIDHIGGIGTILQKCLPGAKVLFHYLVSDYIEGRKKISLIKNWIHGFMPASIASVRYIRRFAHLKFESFSGIPLPGLRNRIILPYGPDKILYFGTKGLRRYALGFDDWEVIETPGHTEDSVSFYNETSKELICGDLILNMKKGGNGKLNRFCSSRKDISQSFLELCRTVNPKTIYPGHGEVIRDHKNALMCVETFSC